MQSHVGILHKHQPPFSLEPIKKVKKSSKVSEQMKQKRLLSTKQDKRKYREKSKLSDDENNKDIYINKGALEQQFPQQLDLINYISLQQFQGALSDSITLQTYCRSIKENSHLFINKTILHLTSGCSCFYSIFAAQAGASKVYCVLNGHNLTDQQNIWMIRQVVKENGWDQVIQVLSWKDFNAQVDIIVGEPMGYCMFFDGMIDRIIQARDLYLDKQCGMIFPNLLKFKCALINDQHFYDKKVQYWNQLYGIQMKTMKKWISHQPIVKIIDPTLIVSQIVKFVHFDLKLITYDQISQFRKRQFQLKCFQNNTANGLTIWFEAQFTQGEVKCQLKGSPWQQSTKFTHVTLYTHDKIILQKEKNIKVSIQGKKYPTTGLNLLKVNIEQIQTVYRFS